jgi:hypothetical protein
MNQYDMPVIKFGRDICGDYESTTSREWLVTNGIGGYASGQRCFLTSSSSF